MFPEVSFIIPALNAEKTIGPAIRSIRDLDYPKDLIEIIVVNNGSTDRTKEIALATDATVIDVPERNRSRARNVGWRQARHNLIAFIDSDVHLDAGWLKAMVLRFTHDKIGAGQGKIIPTGTPSAFEVFRRELSAWRTYQTFNSLRIISANTPILNTAACVYRKAALKAVDGFDEELKRHEDVDLAKRVAFSGYHFVGVEAAVAFVAWHGAGWPDYLLRSFDIGYQRKALELKWQTKFVLKKKLRTISSQQAKNVALFKDTRNTFWLLKLLVEVIVESGRLFNFKSYPSVPKITANARLSLIIFEEKVHALDLSSGRIFEFEAYHALPLLESLGLITFEECARKMEALLHHSFDEDLQRQILSEVRQTGLALDQDELTSG